MRIVIVCDWFSDQMGYVENCLPKALAALGHEVHVITSNAQPYFNSPDYRITYEPFIGPAFVPCGVRKLDGFTLHRLPLIRVRDRLRIRGLLRTLFRLRPDIVQTYDAISLSTCQAALARPMLGFELFTANHVLASVFPPVRDGFARNPWWRMRSVFSMWIPGRLVSLASSRCYPATIDAADIAIRFFGVEERKISIASLGVDTSLFHAARNDEDAAERSALRQKLGFATNEIICVYSGRFSEDKNPACLAMAIGELVRAGERFRGLFIGSGAQEPGIRSTPGCVVHPFLPFRRLPPYYRAADIGVWPRQESTSVLDASASGLPVIISDHVQAKERVAGRGLTYRQNDSTDLARVLRELADPARRADLGRNGAIAVAEHLSWTALARGRLRDYEEALSGR